MGTQCESVVDMGPSRLANLKRVTAALVERICCVAKAGQSDTAGVLNAVVQDRRIARLLADGR